MDIKQLSVFVENKPAALCKMTAVLAQHGIDLRALSLSEANDFGIARIIVDDTYRASQILKEAGYVHSLTTVVGVALPDTPGGLSKVLNILADANINVEYMYAFLGGKTTEHAYVILRVRDVDGCVSALAAKGIYMVAQEEIASL